jgi:hypothetical protein
MNRILRRLALLVALTLGLLIPQGAGGFPAGDSALYRPTPAAQTRKIYLPAIRNLYDGSSIRFAVIGDYGSDSQAEADVANLVKSWGPSFIITVGDNNYPKGAASTIDANIGKYYYEFADCPEQFSLLRQRAGQPGALQRRLRRNVGGRDETPDQLPILLARRHAHRLL